VAEMLTRVSTMSWRDFAALIGQTYVEQGYTVIRINSRFQMTTHKSPQQITTTISTA
jgi:hypothetical protein